MKKYIFLISFLVSITVSCTYGQSSEKQVYEKAYKHSVGVGAGFTTAMGISYRFFPKKYGFQLNLAPYYQDYGKDAFISAGLTLLYNLSENKNNCIYAYLGNHYLYYSLPRNNYYSVYDPNSGTYQYRDTVNKHTELNTGIGIGFEFNTKKRVTLNIMAGYAQYNSFEKLFFTGELALYYRFNMK